MNKEERREYARKYYQENKERLDIKNNNWAKNNRERSREIKNKHKKLSGCNKKYYETHKKEMGLKMKEWRSNNKDKVSKYNKKYRKEHPEKKLKSDKKSLKNLLIKSNYLHIKGTLELEAAYRNWANSVKKRDNNTCKICDNNKKLIAHHILYKSKHPELSLDIDNGVTLCSECHKDFHHLNGYK